MALVDRGDDNSQTNETNVSQQYGNDGANAGLIFKIIGFVVLGLCVAGYFFFPKLASYGTLYIDNPTENEITVKIGDLDAITLTGKSHQEIELKSGTYSVTVNDENLGEFIKGKLDGKAFLNPTKSKYILEEAAYTVNPDDEVPVEDRTIIVDEVEYYGPFTIYEDLYVKGDWGFGLDEILPDEVDLKAFETQNYTIRKKIYRIPAFIEMYDEWYYTGE